MIYRYIFLNSNLWKIIKKIDALFQTTSKVRYPIPSLITAAKATSTCFHILSSIHTGLNRNLNSVLWFGFVYVIFTLMYLIKVERFYPVCVFSYILLLSMNSLWRIHKTQHAQNAKWFPQRSEVGAIIRRESSGEKFPIIKFLVKLF